MLQRGLSCCRTAVALGWGVGHADEIDVADVGVGRAGARASLDRLCRNAACCYQAGCHPLRFGLKVKR